MTVLSVALVLFYWIFLVCVFFITGAFASRVLITGPSGADVCYIPGNRKCLGETSAKMVLLMSVVALLANALFLLFQASFVSDTPLKEVYSVIVPFLLETRYGKLSVLRTGLLAAVLIMSLVATRRGGRLISLAGAAISFLVLVSLSLAGHQGTGREPSIPLLLDILHISTVSLWVGGLFYIRFCYSFLMDRAGPEFFAIFSKLITRFSRMATACVIVGPATGLSLGLINVKSFPFLIHAPYGIVLLAKAVFVAALISLGGVNKFLLLPRLNKYGLEQWSETALWRAWLRRVISAEVVTASAVLLLTSLLSHLSPEG
jgi:putative copper export protein